VESSLPRFGRGLEVGVGTGRFAAPLSVAIGLDPSVPMMKIARWRGVTCIRGVAERLPFRGGAFDLVLMVTVDFLLSDKAAAFREAARVLAWSGAIVVGFIDRESPVGRRYQREKGEKKEEGEKKDGGGGFYGDARFLAPVEMAALLEAAGFSDLKFVQTLSSEPEAMTEVEAPRPGWGRGSFVVVRGKKGR
jgi:SAM-dependent methyltransferase